jgi:thiamine-monophosphate kinase
VLDPGGLVWTVDVQVDGTHFKPAWASWEDIGWRSFMAAASDLAAMGAEPAAALSSLVLAPAIDDAALDALARGQAAASDVVGAPVVGGNLARGTETSITTTLLGRAPVPVLRSGARPGDVVCLAGSVGLAAAGLGLLVQDTTVRNARVQDAHAAACLTAWRRPVARIADGRALAGLAHAAIDVSDGLAHDAEQLAEASGVRIVLDADALRLHLGDDLVAVAARLGRDALDLALNGGEDYALVAASASLLPGFVRIGSVEAHEGGARLLLLTERGPEPLTPRGFDHFLEA